MHVERTAVEQGARHTQRQHVAELESGKKALEARARQHAQDKAARRGAVAAGAAAQEVYAARTDAQLAQAANPALGHVVALREVAHKVDSQVAHRANRGAKTGSHTTAHSSGAERERPHRQVELHDAMAFARAEMVAAPMREVKAADCARSARRADVVEQRRVQAMAEAHQALAEFDRSVQASQNGVLVAAQHTQRGLDQARTATRPPQDPTVHRVAASTLQQQEQRRSARGTRVSQITECALAVGAALRASQTASHMQAQDRSARRSAFHEHMRSSVALETGGEVMGANSLLTAPEEPSGIGGGMGLVTFGVPPQ